VNIVPHHILFLLYHILLRFHHQILALKSGVVDSNGANFSSMCVALWGKFCIAGQALYPIQIPFLG
jgi:hypothetical protein